MSYGILPSYIFICTYIYINNLFIYRQLYVSIDAFDEAEVVNSWTIHPQYNQQRIGFYNDDGVAVFQSASGIQ